MAYNYRYIIDVAEIYNIASLIFIDFAGVDCGGKEVCFLYHQIADPLLASVNPNYLHIW